MDSILRPVLRPVLQPVLRSVFGASGGGGTPSLTDQVQALFTKYSGVGGYWDLTDTATLFQDSAGTTPVTAASQPVGRVLDKSGQGNHFIQSAAASRPAYNGAGITPDGVDDFMQTAGNFDLTACDKVVVAMGYEKLDDTLRMQMELSARGVNPGMFYFISGVDNTYQNYYLGGQGTPAFAAAAGFATPRPNEYGAHVGRASIPGDLGQVWWNGTKGVDSTADRIGGTMGSDSLNLFYRNGSSLFSNTPARRALVMGVPVAGVQVSDEDIELIRLWLMEGVV